MRDARDGAPLVRIGCSGWNYRHWRNGVFYPPRPAPPRRYVTHVKRLRDVRAGLDVLLERLEPQLGSPKLGPFLWQLPPTSRRDDDRLAEALTAPPPGRHTLEFRHESWFRDEVYDLLRDLGARHLLP